MLKQIQLKNFKIHIDTTVDLSSFTLLVGPNGSGKTSVLQGCIFLENCIIYPESTYYKSYTIWKDFINTKIRNSPELIGSWNYENKPYYLGLKMNKAKSPRGMFAHLIFSHDEDERKYNLIQSQNKNPYLKIKKNIKPPEYFKLIGQQLLKPSYCPDVTPKLSHSGSNLASTVAYLMTYDHDRFLKLLDSIQKIIPTVKKVRVRPAKVELQEEKEITVNRKPFLVPETREVIGHELIFDTASGTEVPASQMSEGTLITLGILTAVMHPDCPNTVLLDDIEQGLHPLAQRDLMNTLKKLQKIRPDLQIIATTHSPYIVDELPPSAICVMACDEEGKVYAQTLDKHPDAEHALQVLTTGEFLSAEGEDWVLPNA